MRIMTVALGLLLLTFASADEQFKTIQIKVGGKGLRVEVADTESLRGRGLMFRANLPSDQGMLFVFEEQHRPGFWMKNTLVPLSIGFFNRDFRLVDVQDMEPPPSIMTAELKSYVSREPAILALEVNKGWFRKNGVKNGAKIELVGEPASPLLRRILTRPKSN